MPRPPGHGPDFERKRQAIIDQAAALFATKGYAATGISDICQQVKLGKGALYHYIGSKENLLVEIQNRVLAPLLRETERINAIDVSAMVRLRVLSQYLLTVIFQRLDHIWVYEHDYRHLSKPNRTRVLTQRHEFEDMVRSMLEEAMDAGDLTRARPQARDAAVPQSAQPHLSMGSAESAVVTVAFVRCLLPHADARIRRRARHGPASGIRRGSDHGRPHSAADHLLANRFRRILCREPTYPADRSVHQIR